MNYDAYTFTRLLAVLLAAAGLSACGSLSKNIAADGSGAGTLVWPAADSTDALHAGGSHPTLAQVRAIKAGMSKDAIATAIGYTSVDDRGW